MPASGFASKPWNVADCDARLAQDSPAHATSPVATMPASETMRVLVKPRSRDSSPRRCQRAVAEHHPGSQVKVERPHVVCCSVLYARAKVFPVLLRRPVRRRNDAHGGAGRADAAPGLRTTTATGRPGAVPGASASRRPPIRRSSGARRRTCGGRSRFPGAATRRRSSGATGSTSPRRCRSASPARRSTPRAARCRSAASTASSSWRSIGRPARRSGSTSRAKPSRTSSRTSTTARGRRARRHRRPAALRLLRVVRHLRLRHERQAPLGEGPRRQAHAQRVRRGVDAGDSTATRWSSSGII